MTNGLVVMTPSSIAYSGTSASINADGSVVFSACTSLSLNGVFTSDYDNYMVAITGTNTINSDFFVRYRASGADNSTASSYVYQRLSASGTSVTGQRTTSDKARIGEIYAVRTWGLSAYFFGPYLTQPTAHRSVNALDGGAAVVNDSASTHNQSTAYDGITLYPSSGNMTGLLTVFGFNQ
jgi:hypothetical protein